MHEVYFVNRCRRKYNIKRNIYLSVSPQGQPNNWGTIIHDPTVMYWQRREGVARKISKSVMLLWRVHFFYRVGHQELNKLCRMITHIENMQIFWIAYIGLSQKMCQISSKRAGNQHILEPSIISKRPPHDDISSLPSNDSARHMHKNNIKQLLFVIKYSLGISNANYHPTEVISWLLRLLLPNNTLLLWIPFWCLNAPLCSNTDNCHCNQMTASFSLA